MKDIQIYTPPSHDACKTFEAEIRRDVKRIIKSIPNATLPYHDEHFKKVLLELDG
jgi:hypothetical protein